MITVFDSVRHTGIRVQGFLDDLAELYDAIMFINEAINAPEEGSLLEENALSLRLLSLCYDIRNAIPADEASDTDADGDDGSKVDVLDDEDIAILTRGTGLSFPGNDTAEDGREGKILRFDPGRSSPYGQDQSGNGHGSLLDGEYDDVESDDSGEGPDPDLFEFRILWPEAIFLSFVMQVHLVLPINLKYKKKYKYHHQSVEWAVARAFQLKILECLFRVVPPGKVSSIRKLYEEYLFITGSYCTQYIEYETLQYSKLDPTERPRRLGLLPARIVNTNSQYDTIESQVGSVARQHGVPAWEIASGYLDDIEEDW